MIIKHMLTSKQKGYLVRWKLGEDLRGDMTKATFYRIRRELLDRVGVDIATIQPREKKPDSDRPIVRAALDPAGWDPEPIEALYYSLDPEVKKQYGLI